MDFDILDKFDAKELGLELARARKKKGMTQEDVGKLLGVGRTTVIALEKGERKVRESELIELARAYGCQISDFVRARPKAVVIGDNIQFRGPFDSSKVDDAAMEPAIARFEDLCRDYLELESLMDSPMSFRYPAEYTFPKIQLARAAESVAIEERSRLGLGDGPLPLLRDVLEQDIGLRVFYIEMPGQYSEMYFYSQETGGCLAINRVHPEVRRRWSMAHGLAHFLTNRFEPVILQGTGKKFTSEAESDRFADAFALYYLIPTGSLLRRLSEIRQQSGTLSIAEIFRLADRYGVSPYTMVRRLEEVNELPVGYWEVLMRRVSVKEAQAQLGLGNIPGRDDLLPVRYRTLALDALGADRINEVDFANFLRIDRIEARQAIFLTSDQKDV